MTKKVKQFPNSFAMSSIHTGLGSHGKKELDISEMSYDEVKEKYHIKVLTAEENDNTFDKIIGLTDAKTYLSQIVSYVKTHPETDENFIRIHPSIMLLGPAGVGKALLTYAFAKELELPIVVIDVEKYVSGASLERTFEAISKIMENNNPCVVFFKEIYYVNSMDENKNIAFCSKITELIAKYTDCFFFTSSSTSPQLHQFFVSKGGFDTHLTLVEPVPEERKAIIERELTHYPCEKDMNIDKIVRDFFGMTSGEIQDILKKAFIQTLVAGKNRLSYSIINDTLSSENYGSRTKKPTEKELRATAIHEAGHVIAGYFSDPENYKVSRVEIINRSESLGLTIHEIDEEKTSYFKNFYENRIIMAYGGMAAENIMLHASTSGCSGDIATATMIAEAIVKDFGMDENLGPICLDPEIFDSTVLNDDADALIQNMLKKLYAKAESILNLHINELKALAEALLKRETLYKEEVEIIIKGDKLPSKKSDRKSRTSSDVKKAATTQESTSDKKFSGNYRTSRANKKHAETSDVKEETNNETTESSK